MARDNATRRRSRPAGESILFISHIPAMAGAVLQLKDDPALAAELGARAALRVRQSHDTAIAAPRLFSLIQRMLPCPTA